MLEVVICMPLGTLMLEEHRVTSCSILVLLLNVRTSYVEHMIKEESEAFIQACRDHSTE